MLNVYHHLSDPAHLHVSSDSVYRQYGSFIGRYIFTSPERHISVNGENIEICGGLFTNPHGAAIEIEAGTNILVRDCVIFGSPFGIKCPQSAS